MKKSEKRKRVWLALSIASPISAAIAVGLILWFGLSGWYIPTLVATVFAIHGFYGIPIYIRLFVVTSREIECLTHYLGGVCNPFDIADVTGLSVREVKKRLDAAMKREGIGEPDTVNGSTSHGK